MPKWYQLPFMKCIVAVNCQYSLKDFLQLVKLWGALEESSPVEKFSKDTATAPHVNRRAVLCLHQDLWRPIPQCHHLQKAEQTMDQGTKPVSHSPFAVWSLPVPMQGFGRKIFDESTPSCSSFFLSFFLFFLFFVEISSCTPIPLFKPGPVHSGSVSWDDCG